MTSPIPFFDGHNDALLRLWKREGDDPARAFLDGEGKGQLDLPMAKQGGFAGGFFAIFVPSPDNNKPRAPGDSPVSGSLTNRFEFKEQPNITHPHTILSIPLTRRAVLFGCYEERPAMFYVNELGVLSLNSITIREARQVFSSEADFAYAVLGTRSP